MPPRKKEVIANTIELEPSPGSLLECAIAETVEKSKLPKRKLSMKVTTEKLCCGAYQKVATVGAEAYLEDGKLYFLNPITGIGDDFDRLTIKCDA